VLRVVLESLLAKFSAQSGLLEAAEGKLLSLLACLYDEGNVYDAPGLFGGCRW